MVVVGGRGGAVIYSVGEGGRDGGRERNIEVYFQGCFTSYNLKGFVQYIFLMVALVV